MGRDVFRAAGLAAALLMFARPGQAAEVFGGIYDHALFQQHGGESGFDAMLGLRTAPIEGWTWLAKPSVHVMISANNRVATDFAAIGLNWRLPIAFGGRLYARPGFGFAYTTGEANIGNSADLSVSPAVRQERQHLAATRIDFGSKDLFEPEMAFGYRFTRRWAAEISYVHLSNGQILHQGKNQGLDDAGLRVAYSF
jgi:hypothetical protein